MKKKIFSIILATVLFSGGIPSIVNAQTLGYAQNKIITKEQLNHEFNEETYAIEIETWFNEEVSKSSSIDDFIKNIASKVFLDELKYGFDNDYAIRKTWASYILYELAFPANSHMFSMLFGSDSNDELGLNSYKKLNDLNYGSRLNLYKNVSEKRLTTMNNATGKLMTLNSYYIDNNSDKTVIIHNGYRGDWNIRFENGEVANYENDEIDVFYNLGYNIILMDSRGMGKSDGDYITLGYYESDDVLAWVDNEIKDKPNQDIILYGGSMGGTTVLSAIAKSTDNIKAVIENCGFKSIDEELRHVYELLTNLDGMSALGITLENEDDYMDTINNRYILPRVNIDIKADLPIIGVKTTVPKLFIHGEDDNFVPTQNVYDLYDIAKGYKEIFTVPGAGHGEATNDLPGFTNSITNFLHNVFSD